MSNIVLNVTLLSYNLFTVAIKYRRPDLYFEEDISEEEKEQIIQEIAENIHKRGLDTAAVLFLESSKPLSRLGTSMGRVFLSPFLPILGDSTDLYGHKLLEIFEKRENIERLIQKIEKMSEKAKKEE